jgi:hypothetical protein
MDGSRAWMKLQLKLLDGSWCHVQVHPDDTVAALKRAIELAHEFPVHSQKLIFCGGYLRDSDTVRDSGLVHGTVVHLVLTHAGSKAASAGSKAASAGSKAASAGSKAASAGSKAASAGSKAASAGSKAASAGSKAAPAGSKAASAGSAAARFRTEAASFRPQTRSAGAEDHHVCTDGDAVQEEREGKELEEKKEDRDHDVYASVRRDADATEDPQVCNIVLVGVVGSGKSALAALMADTFAHDPTNVPADDPTNVPADGAPNVPVDGAPNVPVDGAPNVPVDGAPRAPTEDDESDAPYAHNAPCVHGSAAFVSSDGPDACTSGVAQATFATPFGRVRILDTPGLMDARGPETDETHMRHIVQSVRALGTLSALVVVRNEQCLRVDRPLLDILRLLVDSFGVGVLDVLYVAYTHAAGARSPVQARVATAGLVKRLCARVGFGETVAVACGFRPASGPVCVLPSTLPSSLPSSLPSALSSSLPSGSPAGVELQDHVRAVQGEVFEEYATGGSARDVGPTGDEAGEAGEAGEAHEEGRGSRGSTFNVRSVQVECFAQHLHRVGVSAQHAAQVEQQTYVAVRDLVRSATAAAALRTGQAKYGQLDEARWARAAKARRRRQRGCCLSFF